MFTLTATEREQMEIEAEIFSLLMSTDILEKLYIRDTIDSDEYTVSCQKFIAQYKTIQNALDQALDIKQFMVEYGLHCQAGFHRLCVIGVPATLEHESQTVSKNKDPSSKDGKHIANIIHSFVTLIDSLRLGLLSIDQLHPLLSDLLRNLNKFAALPADYNSKTSIKKWLISLNARKANESLSAEDARQLAFDVEQAHDEFYHLISK